MATIIYGKNAVRETIAHGSIKTLYVSNRIKDDELLRKASAKNIDVKSADDRELTRMAKNPSHQGFVAICDDIETVSLEDMISFAKNKKYPLIAILDGIEDPHNLGAILRSADAFGVDGIIMKNRGAVQLNGTVAKVSTGAINYVKVAVVTNLNRAIETLKKSGYWVVASDGEAKMSYSEVDYKCPIAVVIGSEGFGISQLVLKNSDFIVKIPMHGHVNSLNASVAAGIFFAMIDSSRS
ncbi:MAG: 23S rRNA (guanosine(2251)-2'-O)-methyltransferase RlmB [Bacilli bacterium]|nr:23S rRNA (guanosine(2251)-2'-O)-methyltransferase RlmB [Bacilli bacterium]